MAKKEFTIPSTNGKNQLHTVLWTPKTKTPIGIVQISHGMIEYVNRYDRFATFLAEQGFVVIGNDHLGHGKTARDEEELGYMDSPDGSLAIVRDLHRVSRYVKKRYPNLPFFLLGHSMGSFMARRYAMTYGEELDGLLLLGTGYQPKPVLLMAYTVLTLLHLTVGDHCRSLLMEFLAFGTYNFRILDEKSLHAWVTRDKKILEAYDNDPFCTFRFTVNGYKTLFDTLWYIEKAENIAKLPKDLPMFFASGDADPVGGYKKGVKRVVEEYRKKGILEVDLIFYQGARHEILNELEYDRAQEDILEWLMGQLERL